MEEKGTLTSRCSSLTSSQYSLGESQDTSRRGSWSSFQDPNERLDSISIGSYLDTLADDMDEYCHSTSESLISSTPHRHSSHLTKADQEWEATDKDKMSSCTLGTTAAKVEKVATAQGFLRPDNMLQTKKDLKKVEPIKTVKQDPQPPPIANGFLGKLASGLEHSVDTKGSAMRKPGLGSPTSRPYANGKVDFEKCKSSNGKLHLEYDAHWRWVQSQDDVTFL